MSTNNVIVDMVMTDKQRTRREHSAELKAQILAECDVPGASVAKVAMCHGANAKMTTALLDRPKPRSVSTDQAPSWWQPMPPWSQAAGAARGIDRCCCPLPHCLDP